MCPRLDTLSVEGCTSLGWDALRALVESRLPAHHRTYAPRVPEFPRARNALPPMMSASASASAQALACVRAVSSPPGDGLAALGWPRRVRTLDVTKCHQISKEMVQWLMRCGCDVRHDAMSPI